MKYLPLLLAYLLGSVPFGLLIARSKGVDLRKEGSGNIGATNAARILGKKTGLLVLLLDMSKGFLPVLTTRLLWHGQLPADHVAAMTGLFAVMGHCFPIFLAFRGGKGVATAAGVFLALCPAALAVAAAGFVATVWIFRYVSLGSMVAALLMPVSINLFRPHEQAFIFSAWVIASIIWWQHRDNLRRLVRGQESRFR